MIRRIVMMAAAAAMVAAPVVAQAAPQRLPAPVAAESEALGGSPFLLPLLIAALVGILVVVSSDGDEPTSP